SSALHVSAARPKARADHLMGVGLAGNSIGVGSLRGAASGESRNRQVEASPEKVDRTDFPEKAGAEFLKDFLDGHERTPEVGDGDRVVRGVLVVCIEGDGVWHFHRYMPDLDMDSERIERRKKLAIKVSHRARRQR